MRESAGLNHSNHRVTTCSVWRWVQSKVFPYRAWRGPRDGGRREGTILQALCIGSKFLHSAAWIPYCGWDQTPSAPVISKCTTSVVCGVFLLWLHLAPFIGFWNLQSRSSRWDQAPGQLAHWFTINTLDYLSDYQSASKFSSPLVFPYCDLPIFCLF